MEKTIAIVVTYNRRTLLEQCITALRTQTLPPDCILIINNGSTDDTEQWVGTQQDLVLISQNNRGSAGGFNAGINYGFKQGFTWMWCMDDDGYPAATALENLLAAEQNDLTLMNCAVLDAQDKKTFVWKTGNFATIEDADQNIIPGVAHPFNGTLLHRKIVERVGLPRSKYFLWGDETEYLYRIISVHKIPACTVANSVHYHPATRFTMKRDWDHFSGWKMYYYVRNRFPVLQSKFDSRLVGFAAYVCFLIGFTGIILVFQKTNKFRKIKLMLGSFSDALTGNFQATPHSILTRLKA